MPVQLHLQNRLQAGHGLKGVLEGAVKGASSETRSQGIQVVRARWQAICRLGLSLCQP